MIRLGSEMIDIPGRTEGLSGQRYLCAAGGCRSKKCVPACALSGERREGLCEASRRDDEMASSGSKTGISTGRTPTCMRHRSCCPVARRSRCNTPTIILSLRSGRGVSSAQSEGCTSRRHPRRSHANGTWAGREGDREPGYDGMLVDAAHSPSGVFLGWTPGKTPLREAQSTAWRLEPGTDVVINAHMLPTGEPEMVQFQIGFFFTDRPPWSIHHAAGRIMGVPHVGWLLNSPYPASGSQGGMSPATTCILIARAHGRTS